MLIKADSLKRKDQKQKKSVFSLAVVKSLIETIILTVFVVNFIKDGTINVVNPGILYAITWGFSFTYLVLGIYILHKTKEVNQILDLEFYDKEWSSYFQITQA